MPRYYTKPPRRRGELWLPVLDRMDYRISSHGRVWSQLRRVRIGKYATRIVGGRLLKRVVDQDGYLESGPGKIHRMVATAFVPNPDNKPCVNHLDGNKQNNHADNLEWVTPLENAQHAVAIGIHAFMRGNKVFPRDIPVILDRLKRGDSRKDIARDYGVNDGLIHKIRRGDTWKRIVAEWYRNNGPIPNKTHKRITNYPA